MSGNRLLRLSVLLALLLALTALAAVASDDGEGRRSRRRDSRVHDASPSDVEHHDDDDDDDDDGDRDGGRRRRRRHDARYDHESFLGRDESRRFDEQSAEDSKQKLAELFAKIDKNNDTKLSVDEMEAWLAEIAKQEREKQVESRFHSIKAAISAKDMNSSLSFTNRHLTVLRHLTLPPASHPPTGISPPIGISPSHRHPILPPTSHPHRHLIHPPASHPPTGILPSHRHLTLPTGISHSVRSEDWKKAMHHEVIGDEPADKETEESFAQQMSKDEARWAKADANGDKKIDKAEFADFMFADHSPRMKDVVVQEALNVSDLNRDGKVDLAEYMRELYPEYEKENREGKKLPKWVAKEVEFFKASLDLNKDGFLDADEVYKWTVPEDIDHTKRETSHLFEVADEDRDKALSKDEVMKHWEIFVGHRATHFGEFAPSSHDEL